MALEEKLWKQLRDEANSVKDCFTRFSFQALAFSAVMLGGIANYQPDQPVVGLVGILVIVVVLTVSRIGGYKYSTANRHFAYELYHDTLGKTVSIGWEEAQRAWRVVAPALFDSLYLTPSDRPRKWRDRVALRSGWSRERLERSVVKELRDFDGNDRERAERFWFDPATHVKPLVWHPGRFLEQMQLVLHLVTCLALIPVVLMALNLTLPLGPWFGGTPIPTADREMPHLAITIAAWVIVIVTLWFLIVSIRQINARREILESGMLSIPSSAVVWHVVIVAHKKATGRVVAAGAPEHYVHELALVAKDAAAKPLSLWGWLRAEA